MITIRTNTSRLRTAAGELISGALTVIPSASFEYTEGAERRKVVAVPIVVLFENGVLAEDLVLAPTKGAEHDRVNLTYRAIFTVAGNRRASWSEYWELDAAGATVLELDEVTQVSIAEEPAYVVLSGQERALLHTQGTDQTLDQGGANEVSAGALKGHLAAGAAADPHAGYEKQMEKGMANGYAPLDGTGKVPQGNLPAIDFPVTSVNMQAGDVVLAAADVGAEAAGAVAAHAGASDPHPGYQRESEKGTANGYASLDADGRVPDAQIANKLEAIILAASDETTALAVGAAKITFRMPYAFALSGVRASLTTAQESGGLFTVDLNEGGVSVLSTKLTIDNGEKSSTTAATPPVISDSALADDAEITVDIDQVGDGTAKGLKVTLLGVRT